MRPILNACSGRRNYSPSWKIQAIIGNARAFLTMEESGESLPTLSGLSSTISHRFPCRHAGGDPHHHTGFRRPLQGAEKRGFKFVGSTICYSFMQACGLVSDHVTSCFCHPGGDDDPQVGR